MNEVDDDKIIKYRDEEGESQEMPASSAKKLPKDHPAKIAYDTMGKYDDYQDKKDDSEKDDGGKLPRDMYELSSYTKENGGWIGIDDMDFVHVMRAFEKMQEEVTRLKKDNDKFYGKYDEGLQISVSQTNQITKLEQEVSHLREKLASDERARIMRIKDLKERNAYLEEKIEDIKQNYVLREVYELLFDKCEQLEKSNYFYFKRIKSFYESQIPSSVPTATFNYIPNNEEGEKLVDDMKRYLNKERYTLKDRGQCINREKYPLEEVSTDRGIDKKEYGKFLKVHINEKRRSK